MVQTVTVMVNRTRLCHVMIKLFAGNFKSIGEIFCGSLVMFDTVIAFVRSNQIMRSSNVHLASDSR